MRLREPYAATPEQLLHDEELLALARIFLEHEDTITVAPVLGPHSIDLIVFTKDEICFVEVKGPKAALSKTEKRVKALVESGPKLTYQICRYELD